MLKRLTRSSAALSASSRIVNAHRHMTEANAHTVLKVARLLEPKAAKKLIKHALPMAGSEGIDTAKRIQNGTHPIVTTQHDADLARVAKQVLRKYGWISAILLGARNTPQTRARG